VQREGAVSTKLLTAEDVAERLNIPRSTAYELVKRLHPHVRIGRLLRLPESTLERFLAQGGDACPDSSSEPTPPISGAPATTRAPASSGKSRRSRSRAGQLAKRRALLRGDD
jgi:excisionase family DNA binding protein